METATKTKATQNQYGNFSAPSRSGRYRVILGPPSPNRAPLGHWSVHTIRTGTHDLGPHTRNFRDEQAARDYANHLYRTA